MKSCSYCGAEHPDDAAMCAADHKPLGQTHEFESRKAKDLFPVLFAVCCGLGMTLLSIWLLRVIPLSSHSILREAVERSMTVPIVLGTILDGNHAGRFWVWCLILTFMQWSIVGLCLSHFIRKSRRNDAV